ncbi:MAG TPA: hypothetical protein DCE41_12760, partial [Cytophagales bacterium]|nr:hypothetical protein [Cytophagales bacterium]
ALGNHASQAAAYDLERSMDGNEAAVSYAPPHPIVQRTPEEPQTDELEDMEVLELEDDYIDEEKKYNIRYRKAEKENINFYNQLGLAHFNLFGGTLPDKQPIGYANRTYELQQVLHAVGFDHLLLGEALDTDGALGPRTFYVTAKLASTFGVREVLSAAQSLGLSVSGLESIAAAHQPTVDSLLKKALARIKTPELLFSWTYEVDAEAAIAYYAEENLPFSQHGRNALDRIFFHNANVPVITDEERVGLLTYLFKGKTFSSVGFAFRVERSYVSKHIDALELEEQVGSPPGAGIFNFMKTPEQVNKVGFLTGDMPEAAQEHLRLLGYDDDLAALHGFMILHYFGVIDPVEAQAALLKYVADRELQEMLATIALRQQVSEPEAAIAARMEGDPEVDGMEEFLNLVTYAAGGTVDNSPDAQKGETLHNKAKTEYGLVVKLSSDGENQFIWLHQIEHLQHRASINAGSPFRFGLFEDTETFTGFNASHTGEGTVRILRSKLNFVPTESSDEEAEDILSELSSHTLDVLEPVIFHTSEMNPDDPAIVWLYKNLVNENEWQVTRQWVPAGALPNISNSYWKKKEMDDIMETVDVAFTAFGIASIGSAGLIAQGARTWGMSMLATDVMAWQAAATTTRAVISKMALEGVKFGMGELVGMGLGAASKHIFDPKNNYSDTVKDTWGFGMKALLFAGIGGAASFTAFKAMRRNMKGFVDNTVMKNLDTVEKELLEINAHLQGKSPAQLAFEEGYHGKLDDLQTETTAPQAAQISKLLTVTWHEGTNQPLFNGLTLEQSEQAIRYQLTQRMQGDAVTSAIRAEVDKVAGELTPIFLELKRNRERLRGPVNQGQQNAIIGQSIDLANQIEELANNYSLWIDLKERRPDIQYAHQVDIQLIAAQEWQKALEANHLIEPNLPVDANTSVPARPPIQMKSISEMNTRNAPEDGYFGGLYMPDTNEVWITNVGQHISAWRSIIAHELFHAAFEIRVRQKASQLDFWKDSYPDSVKDQIIAQVRQDHLALNEMVAYRFGYSRAADMALRVDLKQWWQQQAENAIEASKGSLESYLRVDENLAMFEALAASKQRRNEILSELYGVPVEKLVLLSVITLALYNVASGPSEGETVQ